MIDSDGPKIDGMPLNGSKRVALSKKQLAQMVSFCAHSD